MAMEGSRGEEGAHRGRILRTMGNEQFTRGMWEYFYSQESSGEEDLV